MTVIGQISLGVSDDRRAGEFWRQALGYVRRPPRFEGDDWIVLEPPPGGSGVAIAMDVSESPAEEFPRVHLDLKVGQRDLDDEVDRLVALGAQRPAEWPRLGHAIPFNKRDVTEQLLAARLQARSDDLAAREDPLHATVGRAVAQP